jgi:site-specific DNA recombinase
MTFGALRQHLANPALIAEYVTTYNQERRRLAREAASDLVRLGKRESEIGRELGRLIDSIAKGVPAEAVAGRIRELQSEREAVAEAIERAQEGENVIALHPTAIERYKRDVADLARELQAGSPEINAGVYSSLRELVVAVVVHAKPNKPGIKVEIRGRLAALCGLDLIPELSGGPMVARDRYRLFPHDPNPRYLLRSSG